MVDDHDTSSMAVTSTLLVDSGLIVVTALLYVAVTSLSADHSVALLVNHISWGLADALRVAGHILLIVWSSLILAGHALGMHDRSALVIIVCLLMVAVSADMFHQIGQMLALAVPDTQLVVVLTLHTTRVFAALLCVAYLAQLLDVIIRLAASCRRADNTFDALAEPLVVNGVCDDQA